MSTERPASPAWTRTPAGPWPLTLLATGATALCAVPLVYLTIRVLSGGPAPVERWLLRERTAELTVTTVALAAAVIIGSVVLGVATAWATTRVRLPAVYYYR